MNEFPGLMADYVYVKSSLVILVASVFEISCEKQTERQKNKPINT